MSLALFHKTAYEQRWTTSILLGACVLIPIVFVHAFVAFPWEQMSGVLQVPFVKMMIRVLTGAELEDTFHVEAMGAFAFVHPVMLAISWTCVVVSATRVMAGEIDAGTADLLLALPVTRLGAYVSVTAWVLLCAPALAAAAWLGVWIGTHTADMPEPLDVWWLRLVAVNSAAMLMAAGGIACLISSLSSRRGRALGVSFAILLSSFFLNWLAAFWSPAQKLAFVGILRYFRPFVIVRDNRAQIGDIGTLLIVAAVAWTLGAWIFSHRDIHTN
jgi:ABC-type transport system involved in multi-copper enzyme maturation permease subunit